MVKVAVTVLAALMLTLQLPLVLVQAPPQPAKTLPDEGVAVRVTLVLVAKLALHMVPGHWMPVGALVTEPVPVPTRLTPRANVGAGATVMFCVTVAAALWLAFPT